MAQAAAVVPQQTTKTVLTYAGFWRRLGAYVVDAAMLVGIEIVLASSISVLEPDNFEAIANVAPVSAALWWAYFAILESSPAQGTLGKLAFSLLVTDVHGDPISFRRAALRHAAKLASSLVLGTGWLLAAFTPRKQALHDVLAGTLVLRKVQLVALGAEVVSEPGDHWDGSHWVAPVRPQEKA
jgi:uncharacterized RDD family membrane protein YckC